MDCERLQTLIKSWYVLVQDEALAPARMVSFMEKHIETCASCLADPVVKSEVEKITAIVLPPSKIPKASKEVEEEEDVVPEEGEESGDDETDDDEVKDEEEDEDVDPDKLEQLTTDDDI
jgi:hypothetical protein